MNKLQQAQEFERLNEERCKGTRPELHMTPRIGWTNDPNGFSYYNEEYHMFYQYYPYDIKWGPMHWGHSVSKDLIEWKFKPVALAPEEEYDSFGCFSGNAIEDHNGNHLLIYTGVKEIEDENGEHKNLQHQCIAIGDGETYTKFQGNPVIDATDIPKGDSVYDFRDPKIWRKKDGTYCCLVANRAADGTGQLLLYKSVDALSWEYHSVFVKNNGRIGVMWECPDFFELDGKGIIIMSPQTIVGDGLEYVEGHGTIYMVGTYSEENDTFVEEEFHPIDYALDFYAPQTVLAPDGRQILMAWMQNWRTTGSAGRTSGFPWLGQMTLPREVTMKNNRMYQVPVRELETYRENLVMYDTTTYTGEFQLDGVKGRVIDMEIEIDSIGDTLSYESMTIVIGQNDTYSSYLKYDPVQSIFEINREQSGMESNIVNTRSCLVGENKGKINLRVVMDKYSMELFINQGEQVMTMTYYTPQVADGIKFSVDGTLNMKIKKYDLIN